MKWNPRNIKLNHFKVNSSNGILYIHNIVQLPHLASSKTFPSLHSKTSYPLSSFYPVSCSPQPLATSLHSVSIDWSILDISYNWIIQHFVFCFFHLASCLWCSSLLYHEYISLSYGWLIVHCMYIPQFVYSIHLMDMWTGFSLAILNSAAVNMHVYVLVGVLVFSSLEYISRSRIA